MVEKKYYFDIKLYRPTDAAAPADGYDSCVRPAVGTGVREIEEIVSAVESHAYDLLLLTRFDGVLAEYNGNPNRVRLPAARRARRG